MSASRAAALFSLYAISAILCSLSFFSIAHASGSTSDAMCSPYYQECPCDQVPDKKNPGKCIKEAPAGELPHSNTHGCPVGTCVDTTNTHITSGVCVAANKCEGILCDGKPCEQAKSTPTTTPP